MTTDAFHSQKSNTNQQRVGHIICPNQLLFQLGPCRYPHPEPAFEPHEFPGKTRGIREKLWRILWTTRGLKKRCFPRQGEAPRRSKRHASPRAMPLRRRRDGAAIQARAKEPSVARVRVPSRKKAPRSSQRCRSSRGGIRGGSRPVRRVTRFSGPRGESSPAPQVPEAPRGGHARHTFRSARLAFARTLRPVICPVHVEWNATRGEPSCADRGSQARGAATHRSG
jgi:hypothetical protein